MTDENLDETHPTGAPVDQTTRETPPQYGVGPFSIREVALIGVWLVAFVVSFFPVNAVIGDAAVLVGGANVWVSGLAWILAIGLPTVAVFLIVLRRLSPDGIRRFGSLGIDQFASVAFSVAALVWLQLVWETVAIAVQTSLWARSWVIWVELVLMLAGVVLTVLAPIIPPFEQDFQDRPEVPAHRNARPVRAVVPRPKRERPAAPAAAPSSGGQYAPPPFDAGAHDTATHEAAAYRPETYDTGVTDTHDTGTYGTDVFAPLHEQTSDEAPAIEPATVTEQWSPADETAQTAQTAQAPAQQAFWALVPVERDIVDDYGRPLFRVGPTAWALVIEDRGPTFVVRHEDGRIGYLHDVSGVTRG